LHKPRRKTAELNRGRTASLRAAVAAGAGEQSAGKRRKFVCEEREELLKSRSIALSLVPLVAASFAACGSSQPSNPTHIQTCVDTNNRVVDTQLCEEGQRRGSSGGGNAFLWYYLLTRPGGYPPGSIATGGSYLAPTGSGVRVAKAGSVARGGFGSTASQHGTAAA
jgi:hypothetical protein